jgi:acyl-CoA synthetase (AMP-forming)/AMP-acid ligase II
MDTPVFPPTDGSLTFSPGLVDFHAEHNPDRPWTVFPSRADPSQLESITFAELAKATHRIAHRIRPQRQGPEASVIALLINCDAPLYAATMHGMSRAGLVVRALSFVLLLQLILSCADLAYLSAAFS